MNSTLYEFHGDCLPRSRNYPRFLKESVFLICLFFCVLFCFVCLLLVSCLLNVAIVFGLSILNCPFGFLLRLITFMFKFTEI